LGAGVAALGALESESKKDAEPSFAFGGACCCLGGDATTLGLDGTEGRSILGRSNFGSSTGFGGVGGGGVGAATFFSGVLGKEKEGTSSFTSAAGKNDFGSCFFVA